MTGVRRWLRLQLLEALRLELLAVQLEQQLARRRLVELADQLEQLAGRLERDLAQLPDRCANRARTGTQLW